MSEQQINHHDRARRLAEYIDSLSHVRDDWPDNHDDAVDMDGEIPVVSYRYVSSEWDGNESVIVLAHTIEELAGHLGAHGGGDYPWNPSDSAIDLDTGYEYEVVDLGVELHMRTHVVAWTMVMPGVGEDDKRREYAVRRAFTSERDAVAHAAELTESDDAKDVSVERIVPEFIPDPT